MISGPKKSKKGREMKTKLLMVASVAVLSACADGVPRKKAFYSEACGADVVGYTRTTFRYGDSYLETKPESQVVPKTEFQIALRPRADSLRSATVRVEGAEDDEDAGWIRGSNEDQKSDERIVVIAVGCVPEAPVNTEYKFDVYVDGVGVLDPRARIVPR